MLEPSLTKAVDEILEAATEIAWIQWNAVGSMASAQRHAAALVDPEALVLLSLSLVEGEKRLWDLLAWWAKCGAQMLSVQRLKNMIAHYPNQTLRRAQEFAYVARHEGRDHRWGVMAEHPPEFQARQAKQMGNLDLVEPAALLLRLRLGLGVGVKADILGFLVGRHGEWANVKVLAAATEYTVRAVRRAADELARARFIQAMADGPAEYSARPRSWEGVLELSQTPPRWCFWNRMFAFVAHVRTWARSKDVMSATPYVRSSGARDLIEANQMAFRWNRIAIPTPGDFVGAAYLNAFTETLMAAARWMRESV